MDGLPRIDTNISREKAVLVAGDWDLAHRIFRLKRESGLARFVVLELFTTHWFDIDGARKELGHSRRTTPG